MENFDQYLEPHKYYQHALKDIHNENVEKCFEELTKKSGVNVEENKATMDKLRKEQEKLNKFSKAVTRANVLLAFTIIFTIIFEVAGIVLLIAGINNKNGAFIGIGVPLLVLGIAILVIWFAVFKKKRKEAKEVKSKQEAVVNQIIGEAKGQMAPLNAIFTPDIPIKIANESSPLIRFDDYQNNTTVNRLSEQFGDKLDTNIAHSTLVLRSGTVNTNPFMLRQVLKMRMLPEVYTGTLVITYTRRVSDGNGGTKTVTVTQTLVAHVTEPKPNYSVFTSLNYYTDAASKLSFARTPAGLEGKSDKEMDKIAYKKEKEEAKKAEKALKKGGNYTQFSNSKFEAYLNATGRDNELEYRLLFTPLAQKNLEYTFSSKDPYGDDVYIDKNKMVTTVSTSHDSNMDYSGGSTNYVHYDYEQIKKNFINYNNNFYRGIYFDLVPLLSIPLYFQHQSAPYLSKADESTISYYEAEALINTFEPQQFKPKNCDTSVILKPNVIGKNYIEVTAYGYKAIPRTTFVPTLGGDGIMHPVPVHYYEYQPVEGNTTVNLNNKLETHGNPSDNGINYKMFKANLAK